MDRLQRAGAGARGGRPGPAARAGQVPGDLRPEPRRVLPGAGRRPQGPGGRRPGHHQPRRAHPGPPAGRDPRTRLDAALPRMERAFLEQVAPALAGAGIHLSSWNELDDDDEKFLVETFEDRIFPVLTPLAVDPGHPFPYISSLSLNLAVVVRDPVLNEQRFARVKVPDILPRFVVLPDGERYIPLEQVIAAHLGQLFPGMEIEEHHPFRVTRNADLTLEEEEAEDLLAAVEIELRRRRFGRAVRLEIDAGMSPEVRALLQRELDVGDDDVYVATRPARPGRAVGGPRARPARPQGPALRAGHALPPGPRRGRAGRRVRRRPPGRPAAAPPLRELPHLGGGVRPPGRGRPQRAGHQDHALPHLGRQPHRAPPHPGGRAGQAGGGHRRAQGPVRRERQRRVGQGAGDRGRARRLRPRGPQGALQVPARGARRGRGPAPLLPHRHRQLQLQDRPPLRGPGPHHLRPRRRQRPHPALQRADRLRPQRRVPAAAGGAPHAAARARRPDQGRGGGRRRAGSHHHEDEQPRRHRHDRRAVRGLRRGGADRPGHPGHLLPDPGRARAVGEHPGAVDRRALPRALPHLPLRQRRPPTASPATSSARPT